MFKEALFIIARTWNQPKYLSMEEWIKSSLTYMMIYYSVIKRNKAELFFVKMFMDLEIVIQDEVNQEEKNKCQR